MNKALILLVAIFVQSQSDGILVPNPNTSHHFQDSSLEGWDGGELPFAEDLSEDYKKRSLTNDAFTRRSALDKNFMRFGRGNEGPQERRQQRLHAADNLAFYRFVRGLKDNFIRFGRGGDKSGFIRFGRTRPDDFFRSGKSLRENFIRFGKPDKSFLNFDRQTNIPDYPQQSLSPEEPLQTTAKSSRIQDNFLRFGKALSNATDLDTDVFGQEDSSSQKEVRRKRRQPLQEDSSRQTLTDSTTRHFPSFPFLPPNPNIIPSSLPAPWQDSHNINTSRLTPFFPLFPNFFKHSHPYWPTIKRDRGNSNFIRDAIVHLKGFDSLSSLTANLILVADFQNSGRQQATVLCFCCYSFTLNKYV